jgi:hypothetical protein
MVILFHGIKEGPCHNKKLLVKYVAKLTVKRCRKVVEEGNVRTKVLHLAEVAPLTDAS